MKLKRILCALVLGVVCVLSAQAQQNLSKRAAKKIVAGMWQMTEANYDGLLEETMPIKAYHPDGTYIMMVRQEGRLQITQQGKWRIAKKGVIEETTYFHAFRSGRKKPIKALVEYEVADSNHITITWDDKVTGYSGVEHYTRVRQ